VDDISASLFIASLFSISGSMLGCFL